MENTTKITPEELSARQTAELEGMAKEDIQAILTAKAEAALLLLFSCNREQRKIVIRHLKEASDLFN